MKKRLLSAFLSVAILFSLMSCLSQGVFAATLSTTVESSTMHHVIATSITTATTKTSNAPVQTIYHVTGQADSRELGGPIITRQRIPSLPHCGPRPSKAMQTSLGWSTLSRCLLTIN